MLIFQHFRLFEKHYIIFYGEIVDLMGLFHAYQLKKENQKQLDCNICL